jgi:hypothetical protein
MLICSGRSQRNLAALSGGCQRQPFRPRFRISALQALELLHHPNGRVTGLGEGKLLCRLR